MLSPTGSGDCVGLTVSTPDGWVKGWVGRTVGTLDGCVERIVGTSDGWVGRIVGTPDGWVGLRVLK